MAGEDVPPGNQPGPHEAPKGGDVKTTPTQTEAATQYEMGRLLAQQKEAIANAAKLAKQFEELGGLIEKTATGEIKHVKNLKEQLSVQTELIEAKRQENQIELAIEQAKLRQAISDKTGTNAIKERMKILVKNEKNLRLTTRYYNQIDTATESMVKSATGLGYQWEHSIFKAIRQTKDGIDGIGTGQSRMLATANAILRPQEIFYGFGKKIWENTIAFNKELMEATATLNKATGMAKQFAGHISETSRDFYRFGLTMGDAAGSIGTLIDGFSDFVYLAGPLQKRLERTSAHLAAIGIGAEDFAKSLTFLTRNMGYAAEEARKLNEDLVVFSESIGMAPSRFMKEFATVIPKLEVYGSRAIDIFKKLEKQSKASGVGIDNLMSATDKMDSFEGAAKAAAHLNAALGDTLFDPMELLFADPAERLRIIKSTIALSGLHFNQLGKFNKRLLAQAAGFEDVAEFERILNGETKDLTETEKDFNKIVASSATIMSNLKTAFMDLVIVFEPVIAALTTITGWFVETNWRGMSLAAILGVALPFAAKGALGAILTVATGASLPFAAIAVAIWGVISAFLVMEKAINGIGKVSGWGYFKANILLIGQLIAELVVNPLIWLGRMFGLTQYKGVNLLEGQDFTKGFANGVTGFKGGTAIVGERGPEMITMNKGANVLTNENLGRTLAALTSAVDRLGGGGKATQVNLVVDGKKLATAVHNNTEYVTI